MSFIMHDDESVDHLLVAKTAQDMHDAIQHYMESHAAWEKGDEVVIAKEQTQVGLRPA